MNLINLWSLIRSSIPLRLTTGLLAVRQSWELAWGFCFIWWVCSRCSKDAALLNKCTRRGGHWKSCGYAKTWIYLQWKNKFYRFYLLVLAPSLCRWGRPLLHWTRCCAAIWKHPTSFRSVKFLCWTFRSARYLSTWRQAFCSRAPPLHCLWQFEQVQVEIHLEETAAVSLEALQIFVYCNNFHRVPYLLVSAKIVQKLEKMAHRSWQSVQLFLRQLLVILEFEVPPQQVILLSCLKIWFILSGQESTFWRCPSR